MKTETRTIYRCEFCNKIYLRKNPAERHEEQCNSNPINFRACSSCEHFKKVEETYYFDTYCGEGSRKVQVFKCDKINSFIHPLSVERNGTAFEFGDLDNVPMKKECEYYTEDLPF